MTSIQTKFIILILGCVLGSSAIIGGAGIAKANRVVDAAAAQVMNLQCSERASELNGLFSRIEQSVKSLSVYTLEQLDSVERIKTDPAYLEEYTSELESVAVNIANSTEGAIAVYIRFNPEYTPSTSGLFLSKTSSNSTFQKLTPTDFSAYTSTDTEHVGWYYIPVKNNKPMWMLPYYNQNINVQMISYVIPIYRDNETIGVVGMDIDFEEIRSLVEDIKIYDSGYAFLTDEQSNLMFHPEYALGTSFDNVDASIQSMTSDLQKGTSKNDLFAYTSTGLDKKMAFRTLKNGMRLVLAAPEAEIDQTKNDLILQILISSTLIAALSVFVTIYLTRRLIRPLKELNKAAQKIAAGDLSISITATTKDEVGMLAQSFQQTANHLQKYINYINGLAYRDALTGVKNKTAYQETEQRLEEQMRLGNPHFAVVVLDINGLKVVNDNYGHDFGDMLIIDSCKLICKVFKRSPVYRIGGDEFVVILENGDYENYAELLREFQEEIDKQNSFSHYGSSISIARGIAIYNSDTDLIFSNVFKRADDAMYQNKTDMKAHRI